jgi:hypothetical protein
VQFLRLFNDRINSRKVVLLLDNFSTYKVAVNEVRGKSALCDELSQYRNGDALIVERKPVQLVVLIQESKAKEGRYHGTNTRGLEARVDCLTTRILS